jgi:hypothetical protein
VLWVWWSLTVILLKIFGIDFDRFRLLGRLPALDVVETGEEDPLAGGRQRTLKAA